MEDAGSRGAPAGSNDEHRMISWKDGDLCERFGIPLKWGEYYLFHTETSSDSSCDEEGSDVSVEEADEAPEEEVNEQLRLAWKHEEEKGSRTPKEREQAMIYISSNEAEHTPRDSTLMGMPDILLEKILHYATKRPSEVCVLEIVCKRIHRLAWGAPFWARHPCCHEARIFARDNGRPVKMVQHGRPCFHETRETSFISESLRQISINQHNPQNEILAVLGDGTSGVEAFRSLSADLLSQMMYVGSDTAICFRLRGDTVGYITELLQECIIRRMQNAILLATHAHRLNVRKDDVVMSCRCSNLRPHYLVDQEPLPTCNVGMKEHRIAGCILGCSCSLPSNSGTVWRWPSHDCHDVLPTEAGRRIIRRMAYAAGIREMSNEAFVLFEAELLHMLGLLLVDAFESSVDMAGSVSYLDTDDALVYRVPSDSVDMSKVPPPPLYLDTDDEGEDEHLPKEPTYTIVPGQIKASAKRRSLVPYDVYGDTWVSSPGFTVEEEKKIEKRYYYKEYHYDSSDTEHDEDDGTTGDFSEHDSDYCFDDDDSCSSGAEDLDRIDDMDWEITNAAVPT